MISISVISKISRTLSTPSSVQDAVNYGQIVRRVTDTKRHVAISASMNSSADTVRRLRTYLKTYPKNIEQIHILTISSRMISRPY